MPAGVTWDEAWDRMLAVPLRDERPLRARPQRARSVALDPKLTVDFNYHGNPPFAWEVGQRPVQHAGIGDFVTGETGVWAFSALSVSLNAEFYRAATPGIPFQVAMQRGVRMYHDQTTRPLNDIRWELFTLLAHGAFVTMIDKTAYDGWLDPAAYDRIGAAFREALAKREHFGQRPVAEVGIYYSSRSRDWVGRGRPLEWMQSFLGAHKALVYEHIPFGVVLDENVTRESLGRFPVVLLSNAGIVSPGEVSLLRRHVEEGGSLILTGHCGLFGRRGEPLGASALEELSGARLVRRLESLDNWVRFPTGERGAQDGGGASPDVAAIRETLRGAIPPDWPFLVKGPAAVLEATAATPVGELLVPHRTALQKAGKQGTDWPMSADAPVGPALLVHRLGKGTVVTIAASPDFATASEHHVVEARKLLRNAVRFLNPRPAVRDRRPGERRGRRDPGPWRERATSASHRIRLSAPDDAGQGTTVRRSGAHRGRANVPRHDHGHRHDRERRGLEPVDRPRAQGGSGRAHDRGHPRGRRPAGRFPVRAYRVGLQFGRDPSLEVVRGRGAPRPGSYLR